MIKVDGVNYIKESDYHIVMAVMIYWFILSYLIIFKTFNIVATSILLTIFTISLFTLIIYIKITLKNKNYKESSV
jgi:hypothetical protein